MDVKQATEVQFMLLYGLGKKRHLADNKTDMSRTSRFTVPTGGHRRCKDQRH